MRERVDVVSLEGWNSANIWEQTYLDLRGARQHCGGENYIMRSLMACTSHLGDRMIKLRIMRWVGHVARVGAVRVVYRVLVGKSEGNRPPGRHRRRWEDNINIDLQEVQ